MEATGRFKHIFFIGIGGIGMSAIAGVLLERGYRVSGSDISDSDIVMQLQAHGATIFIGQNADNIDASVDVVVRSTAIQDDNPEIQKAKTLNIPIWHRSEMLGYLMKDSKAICVAGSHGKTTTSSMIALCLEWNRIEPTFVVGGVINEIGTNAKNGKSEWFVAEADESDGSFVNLYPWYAIITNIDEDHLDHYKDISEIKQIFETFIRKNHPDGQILICADDAEALSLQYIAPGVVETYGEAADADYQIRNQRQEGKLNKADIYYKGECLGELALQLPGKHYISNATAALASCMYAGLTFQQVADVLQVFKGTKRRFQIAGHVNDITVVDDYAHHPNEIRATIQAAKDYHKGRLVAVFQPHRYTRTQFLANDFADALSDADAVYLLDVYPAGEKPIPGVSSELIANKIVSSAETEIVNESDLPEVMRQVLQPGDLVLVMGAGSIWKQAPAIVQALEDV